MAGIRNFLFGSDNGALVTEARSMEPEVSGVLIANAIGFLSQAYEATAGLLGNSLRAMAANPVSECQLPQLIRDVLRFDPPVQNTRRYLCEASRVAGAPVEKGATILVLLAAANRDPALHAEPDHFTFSHGAHACPGSNLAATIVEAALRVFLEEGLRFEEFTAPVKYRPSVNLRIPLFDPVT